jgi:hypothetical protein
MLTTILCESGRRIAAEKVNGVMITINEGLILGVGTDGVTVVITPRELPSLQMSYLWADFLKRLLEFK